MIVRPIQTDKILPGKRSIFDVLDHAISELEERSVVVVASKIVALCEGRVEPMSKTDKNELLKREADLYLPSNWSEYNYQFSVAHSTLIASAGIDESNSGGDYYVLWPKDPQRSVNEIRTYLAKKHDLKEVGVIISDSTCTPMRWGTVGVALRYSGFDPINSYVGKPDLFNRPFKVSKSGIATGLAASAVLVMGEGTEQTPIVVLTDLPFVKFQGHDPTLEELKNHFYMEDMGSDLFGPFLKNAPWQKGERDKPEK
jgi:F420-0:gamma-glutamyl ligase